MVLYQYHSCTKYGRELCEVGVGCVVLRRAVLCCVVLCYVMLCTFPGSIHICLHDQVGFYNMFVFVVDLSGLRRAPSFDMVVSLCRVSCMVPVRHVAPMLCSITPACDSAHRQTQLQYFTCDLYCAATTLDIVRQQNAVQKLPRWAMLCMLS